MKRRRIKLLYALLTLTMALLIALTGTFVPQLMLDAKADRLATGTGAVENGDVSPYTYTMDTETRLPKLAALVEQMSVFLGKKGTQVSGYRWIRNCLRPRCRRKSQSL